MAETKEKKKELFNRADGWHPTGPGGKLQYWEKGQLKAPGTNAFKLLSNVAREGNELIGQPLRMIGTDVKSGLKDTLSIGQYSDQVRDGKRLTINQVKQERLKNEGKIGTEGGFVRYLSELGSLDTKFDADQLSGTATSEVEQNPAGVDTNTGGVAADLTKPKDKVEDKVEDKKNNEGEKPKDPPKDPPPEPEPEPKTNKIDYNNPDWGFSADKKGVWHKDKAGNKILSNPSSIQKDLLKAGFTDSDLIDKMTKHGQNYGGRRNLLSVLGRLLNNKPLG